MLIEQSECNTTLSDENKFYVILSGSVGVYLVNKDQQTLISIKKEGSALGEMAIFSGKTKTSINLVCFT